ncbi:HAD family phosphatase [Candidatus Beckwithbacteria bacterium]|nr:HAD family phosphatase [Candidatus Beckwithbacteria bacterium]
MNKPVFVFDVDKTLTNLKREITPRTQTVLKKLQQKGYVTAVATGRKFSTLINSVMPFFPPESLHIVAGGGEIVKTKGDVVWQKLIPEKYLELIYELVKQNGGDIFYSKGEDYFIPTRLSNTFKNDQRKIKVKTFTLNTFNKLTEVTINGVTENLKTELNKIEDLTKKYMTSYNNLPYVDITAKEVNKASTLMIWAELQKINLTDIISFGDSQGDLEMLQLTGKGIAMGNATDEIKSIAHEVIGHTDENGLALYLEKYL